MIPKYRFWSMEDKKMYEVLSIHLMTGMVEVEGGKYFLVPQDGFLMEFIGLFDKNGNEIFEGDVVTFEDCDDIDTDFVYVNRGVIEYAASTFHITNRDSTEMEDLLDGNTLDVIVLGNIHEHPELVEGGG